MAKKNTENENLNPDNTDNATESAKNETQGSGFKKYESLIYKWHRIGSSIQFQGGFYQAKSKSEEKLIESDPLFGQKIFASQ